MCANFTIEFCHLYIYIYNYICTTQAGAQTLASLRLQAPVFSGISNQDSLSAMSASRSIQAACIFYLDNLLATASALYASSCLLFWLHFSTSAFSPITIFWMIPAIAPPPHASIPWNDWILFQPHCTCSGKTFQYVTRHRE